MHENKSNNSKFCVASVLGTPAVLKHPNPERLTIHFLVKQLFFSS